MNEKVRIELDEETAEVLKARAAARGMTVSALVAELIGAEGTMPPELRAKREAGEGPWAGGWAPAMEGAISPIVKAANAASVLELQISEFIVLFLGVRSKAKRLHSLTWKQEKKTIQRLVRVP